MANSPNASPEDVLANVDALRQQVLTTAKQYMDTGIDMLTFISKLSRSTVSPAI